VISLSHGCQHKVLQHTYHLGLVRVGLKRPDMPHTLLPMPPAFARPVYPHGLRRRSTACRAAKRALNQQNIGCVAENGTVNQAMACMPNPAYQQPCCCTANKVCSACSERVWRRLSERYPDIDVKLADAARTVLRFPRSKPWQAACGGAFAVVQSPSLCNNLCVPLLFCRR